MTEDPGSLDNLRDIALPPPVPWWPPAEGWWLIAAAFLAALAIWLLRAAMRFRADAYRRQARRELDAWEARIGEIGTGAMAAAISTVLKRAAIAAFPREAVANLSGSAWLAFLDRSGKMTAFTQGLAAELPALACRQQDNDEGIRAALAAARAWLSRHRADGPE